MRTARLLEWFRVAFKPLIWALNTASNAMLRAIGTNPKAEFDEASSSEDLKLLIAQSQTGGKLDPGEAGMLSGVFHLHEQEARQVMTPIPAVVTVDVAESAEDALRRCVDSGHTRLVVTEDGNTDRIRGIVHNNSLARRLMNEGPGGLDRGQRQGRADRARDQAAGRPAGRPPARARLDRRRGGRVRAHRRHRLGRGHRRGGRGRDRRRDRPRRGRASAGWATATGGCAATCRSTTSWTTGWRSRTTPTPTTPSAGSCSASWAGCPSAATWCASTATRCGWSRCARTGSRRCASATTAARRPEAGAPLEDDEPREATEGA